MSTDYLLNFSTLLDRYVLIDDIKDRFSLDRAESNSNCLNNSKGLNLFFACLDEEDKDYIMQETGMSLNQRIFFSLANNNKNYLECTELMYRIVVYVLGKLNGDISFAYISSDVAILERRTSVLAVDRSSLEWYSELTALSPVMRYTLTAESLAYSKTKFLKSVPLDSRKCCIYLLNLSYIIKPLQMMELRDE